MIINSQTGTQTQRLFRNLSSFQFGYAPSTPGGVYLRHEPAINMSATVGVPFAYSGEILFYSIQCNVVTDSGTATFQLRINNSVQTAYNITVTGSGTGQKQRFVYTRDGSSTFSAGDLLQVSLTGSGGPPAISTIFAWVGMRYNNV